MFNSSSARACLASVAIVAIAGCGGGSGSSPTSTAGSPSPASAPAPSPTPSPTPTVAPTPAPLPVSFDFNSDFEMATSQLFQYAYFRPTGGSETFSGSGGAFGRSVISFFASPERVDYTYPNPGETESWTGAQLTTATPSRLYENGSLKLIITRPYQHAIYVAQEDTASFVRNSQPGTLRTRRVSIFFNDAFTGELTMDHNYASQTYVFGGMPGVTGTGAYSSRTDNFTVRTGSNAVSGAITVSESVGGAATEVARLRFTGTFDPRTNDVSGDITDTVSGFSGEFGGKLVGPERQEMVIRFSAEDSSGRTIGGTVLGEDS